MKEERIRMKKLMILMNIFILSFVVGNVQAVSFEKNILNYGNKKIESVQFDPSGNSIYFVSAAPNGKSAVYLCRPYTKKVYLVSPLSSPTGELYNSYSPQLSPNGKYLVYLRSSGEIFTASFKRELVVRNLAAKSEVVIDSTTPANPNVEFSLSKRPWAPNLSAFTYTVVDLSNEPKSYVATAQWRTKSYWYKKILDSVPLHTFTNSIWSPQGGQIAYMVEILIPIGPDQPPLFKQYVNVVNANTGVWFLSLDVSKADPEYVKDIDWDLSENYIYYSYFSEEGFDHGGFLLGRIHLTGPVIFPEDDYGINLFSGFSVGQVADGHIIEFFMNAGTGDLYVTREITNGAAFAEDKKETTQVIQIPFANQNTFFEITPVNFDDHILESVDFNQSSYSLAIPNSGIFAYVKRFVGWSVTYELWIYGDLKS